MIILYQNTVSAIDFWRKTLRAMKLIAVLTFAVIVQLHAEVRSQSFNFNEPNTTVKQMFKQIEKNSQYSIFYRLDQVNLNQKINVLTTQASIETVMSQVLKNQPLTFEVVDQVVVVKLNSSPNSLREIIKGQVTDSKGQTLPGVSIKVKGSSIGTSTNADGNYSFNFPEGSTLIFSYIGFVTQEIAVSGRTTIDVVLKEDAQSLGEVVVTALGIERNAKSLGYSVTQLKGDDFAKARENNLGTALSGKVAGVNATSSSTGPTGESRVIIRGNGSISGNNQPLYIVNDVPISNSALSSINPDDVESLSVLKGGTAAALYGSQAANGVILITTKSGKAQSGIGVDFISTYTAETFAANTDWQYEYGSGSRGKAPISVADAIANGRTSWGAKLDGSPVIQLDGVSRPYSAQSDNYKNFYNTGNTFSNSIALSGGSENMNIRFSASNMDNSGIVPNVKLNRKTFNLASNVTLAKKLVFQGRIQYSLESDNNRTATNDFVSNPNGAVALVATSLDVRTLSPGYDSRGFQTEWNDYNFVMNPYFAVNKLYNNQTTNRFLGNASLRYNILPSLYATVRAGLDRQDETNVNIGPTGALTSPEGSVTEGVGTNYRRNLEALVGFSKTIKAFSVNAVVGGNQRYSPSSTFSASSGRLNIPFQYFVSNGLTQTFTRNFSEFAVNSLYGSVDLAYNNLYLGVTGRQDWFSTLSKESNTIFYPSVTLSYVPTDGWDSKPNWLNYGKLRGSWAQVGGGAPAPYGLDLLYAAGSTPHLGQPLMNVSGSTIPNALRPYTSTTTEFGFETRLFDNIFVDLTLYDKTTTNDIVNSTVARSSGYNSVQLNVGKMWNRGVELLITGTPFKSSNSFQWDVSYNMAYNKNKVIQLAPGLTNLSIGGSTRTGNGYVYAYEGMPFGMVSGYKFRQDASGNVVYNKNTGVPDRSAFTTIGPGVAPWTMGITNNFKYKALSASFLVDGKFGSVLYSATNDYAAFFGLDKRTTDNNVRQTGVNVSGVDQTGAPFSKNITAQEYWQGLAFVMTDPFVYDASFVKLRQVVVGVNLPKNLISKAKLQSASLNFVARNLFILYKNVPNIDPEAALGATNGQGTESIGTPNTRSFGLNLTAKF